MTTDTKNMLDLSPEFVARVGETNIKIFEEHISKVVADFDAAFLKAVGDSTDQARTFFGDVLGMPRYAEHRAELMNAARDLVLDRFMCTLITYVAEVAVDLGHKPSDLVYHQLTHIEAAQRHASMGGLAKGLLPLLRQLAPTDLQAELIDLAKKREERQQQPPVGG